MSECRLCGRPVTGAVCPACGTPVGESVPWAPLDGSGRHGSTPSTPEPADWGAAGAYPAPGYPAQGFEESGYPAQGDAPQGYPTPGYPAQGFEGSGYPAQGFEGSGYPAQGYNAQGYPPQEYNAQGYPPQEYNAQGYPPQGNLRPGGSPRRPWLPVVAALLVVGLVVVGFLVGQRFLGATSPTAQTPAATRTTATATTPSTPTAPASSTPTVPATTPAVLPEAQALAALGQGAAADLPRLNSAVNAKSWVAQLSSKSVGIEDPRQTAANGTHVFFAADIWVEHTMLKARATDVTVILADSRTYGTRATDTGGRPYWRTIALSPAFTSEATVTAWCQRTFPTMSGADLENQCIATRL